MNLAYPNTRSATRKRTAASIDLTVNDDADILKILADNQTSKHKRRKGKKPSRRECSICCELVAAEQFPSSPHDGASEDHAVCYSCWEYHLHAELERKAWDALSCAHCGKVLELADIYKLDGHFDVKVEPRVMELATKALLREDRQWVDCPSAACQSGATMQDGHIFTCQVCQHRYCFSCNVQMHEGESCTEYQEGLRREPEKVREEELSLATIQAVSKPCPNCRTNLDKFTGCDHVTCRICQHEFCWLCFADYNGDDGIDTVGNSAHKPECEYFPDKLPSYQAVADEFHDETAAQQQEVDIDSDQRSDMSVATSFLPETLDLARERRERLERYEMTSRQRREETELEQVEGASFASDGLSEFLRGLEPDEDTQMGDALRDLEREEEELVFQQERERIELERAMRASVTSDDLMERFRSLDPDDDARMRAALRESLEREDEELAFQQGREETSPVPEGNEVDGPEEQDDGLNRFMRSFIASQERC